MSNSAHGCPFPDALTELRRSWGRYPWQWYVTLTFRGRVGEARANVALWRWLRDIRKSLGHRPEFVAVTELQRRGVAHFHLLMLGVESLLRLKFKDRWERNGYARVVAYDSRLGAAGYLGKYLLKDAGAVQVSRSLGRWYPDPDSPTVRALGKAFDVGHGEQLTTPPGEAGPSGLPVPLSCGSDVPRLAGATGSS